MSATVNLNEIKPIRFREEMVRGRPEEGENSSPLHLLNVGCKDYTAVADYVEVC